VFTVSFLISDPFDRPDLLFLLRLGEEEKLTVRPTRRAPFYLCLMTETFSQPPGLLRIKEVFDRLFADQGIVLPEEVVTGRLPGSARQQGGSGLTRFAWGQKDGQPYLEFYSFHRIWGDYHGRVYTDGSMEILSTLQTNYVTGRSPEDDQRSLEQMHEHNRRLLEDLEEAGLGSGGPVPTSFTINAYLTTADRTEQTAPQPRPDP
jgi:hypothetical protein